MKKRIILKESQLIDMIEKIVKRTQAQNIKEAQAAKVQSNVSAEKKDMKKVPFTKPKPQSKENGLNKVGKSIPTSRKADIGPQGGFNQEKRENAPAVKTGKLAKENPTPADPMAFKKVNVKRTTK
jgi:hypothetical protein